MAFSVFIGLATISALIAQAASSCPRHCTCNGVTVDNQAGVSVDCSHQFLDVFPSTMPSELLSLDFSRNSLDRIPNRIRQLAEMRHLNLSNNRIHYAVQSEIFENNAELRVLDLSGNMLSSFMPESLIGLQRLEVLDLHNNLMVSLSGEVLQPLPLTVTMCLGDNHWACNCDMYSALIRRYQDGPADTSVTCRGGEPECTSPDAVYGRLFSKISSEEELCVAEEGSSSTLTSTTSMGTTNTTTNTTTQGYVTNATVTQETTTVGQSAATTDTSGDAWSDVTARGIPVVSQEDQSGLFLTKEIVTYGVIVLGGMVLIIFLLIAVLFSRMASKRRSMTPAIADAGEDARHDSLSSPWPLLQSQRRLPPIVPAGDEFTCSSDYQEIPVKVLNGDYREYRREVIEEEDEEDELLGATSKSLYMTSISNDGSNMRPYGADAYIPMHAPKLVDTSTGQSDLYAPREA